MGNRFIALGIALTAILTAVSCVPATAQLDQAYYSVGITAGRLYVFGVGAMFDGQPKKSLYDFGAQASLSDVATSADGKFIFVTDGASKQLFVFEAGATESAPQVSLVKTISLTGAGYSIFQPVMSVTPDGQSVYVVDRSGGASIAHFTTTADWSSYSTKTWSKSFAYPTPSWGGVADVATLGSTDMAIIPHYVTGTDSATRITNLSNTGEWSANAKPLGDIEPARPQAIAVHTMPNGSEYAYVTSDGLIGEPRTLSVFNAAAPPSAVETYLLPFGMTPETAAGTLTTLSFGGLDYLCMVGSGTFGPDTSKQQAWLVQLDENGQPMLASGITRYAFGPGDLGAHSLAASLDGRVLWISSADTGGSVIALDNSNLTTWGLMTDGRIDMGERVVQIADLHYVPVFVPEPSSLLALSSLGLGAVGFIRFRRVR